MFDNKTWALIAFVVLGGIALGMSSQILETNTAGEYIVMQEAGTGTMEVKKEPGIFLQMFGDVHHYRISDTYNFTDDEPIEVRFGDAATAKITGSVKFRLSLSDEKILAMHQDFRSYESVVRDLIRQVMSSSLKQTATLFRAEEVYSTRRSEFIALINQQMNEGLYATNYTEEWKKDEDGNMQVVRNVNISFDKDTRKPIVAEQSAFKRYGVEVVQLVINDPEFDPATNGLIAKRKEAEQEKVVAKSNAERAKQDAITASEQGKARVAEAEANALVIKKTAVVNAEKEKEVAEQDALRAAAEKQASILRSQGEAEAARLKVAAGLTPLEKAQIDKETAIGVATAMSNMRFPTTMVMGGGDKTGGPLNPFDAVGLQSFIDISKKLTRTVQE